MLLPSFHFLTTGLGDGVSDETRLGKVAIGMKWGFWVELEISMG
jgi:hypothetical protein